MALGHWAVEYLGEGMGQGGSGGGGLVIHQTVDAETKTMDKTWQEIFDAVQAGQYVCLLEEQGEQDVTQQAIVTAFVDVGRYIVGYYMANGEYVEYGADSADGYPVNKGTPK